MKTEPVAIVAAIVTVIELIFPVLMIFEILSWTEPQLGAVMALILGVGAVVGTLVARSKVSPVS